MNIQKTVGNVDLLDIGNPCNLQCRHCYYGFQSRGDKTVALNVRNHIATAGKIYRFFKGSKFFLYPMEICTSLFLLPIMQLVGQKVVLSNGMLLSGRTVNALLRHGIEEVKVTLYATYKQHSKYYGTWQAGSFKGITRAQYVQIQKNIELCVKKGLRIVAESAISSETRPSVANLAMLCDSLGVERLELLRLLPLGAAKKFSSDVFTTEIEMMRVVDAVEEFKAQKKKLRMRYYVNCGPEFSGKSEQEVMNKIVKNRSNFADAKYLCPAIGGEYLGVSLQTGIIHGCILAKNERTFDVGKIDPTSGEVKLQESILLDEATLGKNLRGICRKDVCRHHRQCLGGCRAAAFAMARFNDQSDPFFAGMDFCVTNYKERLG